MMRKLATGTIAVLACSPRRLYKLPDGFANHNDQAAHADVIDHRRGHRGDTYGLDTGRFPRCSGVVTNILFRLVSRHEPVRVVLLKPNSLFLGPGAAAYGPCVGPTEVALVLLTSVRCHRESRRFGFTAFRCTPFA